MHHEKFGFENYGYAEEIYNGNVILSAIQYDFEGNLLTTTEHTYPSESSHIIRTYDNNSNLKLESEESDGVNIARKYDNGQIVYEEKNFDNGNSEVKEYNQNGQAIRDERRWTDNGRKYGILYTPQTDVNGITKLSDNAMYISSSGSVSGYNLLSAEDKAYYDSL